MLVELLRLFLLRVENIEEQELVRGRHGILEFLRRQIQHGSTTSGEEVYGSLFCSQSRPHG